MGDRDANMLEQAVLRAEQRHAEHQADLRQLAASLAGMVRLLVDKGVIAPGELDAQVQAARVEIEAAERTRARAVKLHVLGDKYAQDNADVDCAARFAVCRGACCGMEVPLSVQDLEEGAVRWDLARPYILKREDDGRCTHQDRGTFFCGNYEHRPLPCRAYSCKGDVRIWRDFDRMVGNEKGIAALLAQRSQRPLQLTGVAPTLPRP